MKQGCERYFPTYYETAQYNVQDKVFTEMTGILLIPKSLRKNQGTNNKWKYESSDLLCEVKLKTIDFWRSRNSLGSRRRRVPAFSMLTAFLSVLLMWSRSALLIGHWGVFSPNCSTNKGQLKWSAGIIAWVNRFVWSAIKPYKQLSPVPVLVYGWYQLGQSCPGLPKLVVFLQSNLEMNKRQKKKRGGVEKTEKERKKGNPRSPL